MKPEHQARLQSLLARYLTTGDIAAMQALSIEALGPEFLASVRRSLYYLEKRPKSYERMIANLRSVTSRFLSSPEFEVAREARSAMQTLRESIRQSSGAGDGYKYCPPEKFVQSIAAFARALIDAHRDEILARDDIEGMTADTFTALPGWTLIAAIQEQVEQQVPTVVMSDIVEEVFHRVACRASVEEFLTVVNAIAGQAQRMDVLAEARRTLATVDADSHVTTLALAARRVGNEMLSGDRQLFRGLCAQAYEKFALKKEETE